MSDDIFDPTSQETVNRVAHAGLCVHKDIDAFRLLGVESNPCLPCMRTLLRAAPHLEHLDFLHAVLEAVRKEASKELELLEAKENLEMRLDEFERINFLDEIVDGVEAIFKTMIKVNKATDGKLSDIREMMSSDFQKMYENIDIANSPNFPAIVGHALVCTTMRVMKAKMESDLSACPSCHAILVKAVQTKKDDPLFWEKAFDEGLAEAETKTTVYVTEEHREKMRHYFRLVKQWFCENKVAVSQDTENPKKPMDVFGDFKKFLTPQDFGVPCSN